MLSKKFGTLSNTLLQRSQSSSSVSDASHAECCSGSAFAAGVEFIAENGGGAGVRLRKGEAG